MTLKPKDRAVLADDLWFSLDDSTRDEVRDAWASEIKKRLRQLDTGKVATIPGEQVMREARKLVRKKRSA